MNLNLLPLVVVEFSELMLLKYYYQILYSSYV